MAVVTRSKAKQARLRRLPTGPSSRSLRRTTTRVIVCASATGEGVHTRWLRTRRTSQPSSSEPTDDSERYVTPAPTAIQIPGAPLKARGPNLNLPRTPPHFSLKPMEGIEEEGENTCGAGPSTLGSPFSSSPQTNRPLERQETVLSLSPEGGARSGEGSPPCRQLRRAYGANGTHLVDSEGKDIWV